MVPIRIQDDFAGLFVFDIMLGIRDKELAKDPAAITMSCHTMIKPPTTN